MYLRSLELGDLDRTMKWHNDPELYRSLVGTFRYVSRVAEEAWLTKKAAWSSEEVNLSICLTSNSRHIGNICLRNIDWVARHAEMAIFMGESRYRSKGYGGTAVKLLTRHALRDMGLVRLYSLVLEDNKASAHMLGKCGFLIEGKLRKHAFKNGKFMDVLLMGLCMESVLPEIR